LHSETITATTAQWRTDRHEDSQPTAQRTVAAAATVCLWVESVYNLDGPGK